MGWKRLPPGSLPKRSREATMDLMAQDILVNMEGRQEEAERQGFCTGGSPYDTMALWESRAQQPVDSRGFPLCVCGGRMGHKEYRGRWPRRRYAPHWLCKRCGQRYFL